MKHVKFRIFTKAIGFQLLIALIMKLFVPILLNYPPNSEIANFQKQIEPLSHNEQYLLLGIFGALIQVLILYIFMKSVFKYLKKLKNHKPITQEETVKVRQQCFKLPSRMFIAQFIILLIILMMLFTMANTSRMLLYAKFILVYFSLFAAEWVLANTMLQNDLQIIIQSTYSFNNEVTLPKNKTKFYINLIKGLLPFFLVVIVILSLVGYSKISEAKGNNKFAYYKQIIDNLNFTGESVNEIKSKLNSVKFSDDLDYYFIIKEDGDKYFSKEDGNATIFFTKYIDNYYNTTNGRIYEYFGIEEEAYCQKVTLSDGTTAYVGIKYDTSDNSTFIYFIIIALVLTGIYIFILSIWARNTSKNIAQVSERLSEIAKTYSVDYDNVLPAYTNDEIGQLVISFNKIQDLTKENIQKIKDNQDMLMERERLATLGQMIGGIAHNLKTPIMSISGAMEGLQDLIKEYDESIEDPEVTKEDHHAIAKDMSEWVSKVKSYDSYMSEIITAVKGQAVNFNDSTTEKFTIEELINRVNILMKHELKGALVTLNIDCRIEVTRELTGNVNALVQVVNNLIQNAIQAYNGEPNKSIDLIIDINNNNIVISVRDYGPGIPESVKEKLFKSMVTTKGHKGSGLGLFMSYSTIKGNFHGDMSFESKEGEGTTFILSIPS